MKYSIFVLTAVLFTLCTFSCVKSEQDTETSIPLYFYKDFIMSEKIQEVRLADGAPLDLEITYRWKITDVDSFYKDFGDPNVFDSLILKTRAREITDLTTVQFDNIDSVFTSKRETYINEIRNALQFQLGGNEATIKEVIVTNLVFPPKYTHALEKISLQKKEVERIKQESIVQLAQSEANRKKAESDGKVQIAQAEAKGKLEKIQTRTEESRRASMLAKAETQRQVVELQALADARKHKIAAEAELDQQAKHLAMQREDQRAKNNLALQNEEQKNAIALENNRKSQIQKMELDKEQRNNEMDMELRFAQLCTDNPNYATYLVNKELASQVEIAILPTGAEMNLFDNMIKKTIGTSIQ